ncbi:MAG TPA: hypothetical protein PK131_01655 [Candidatus Woesebacteria bacterium]|nr:hypothetical protein [Candidatus Woesebacteria bacterium]HRS22628.1 hypothetical protein [Candidatus Woesebacteria bacterium]
MGKSHRQFKLTWAVIFRLTLFLVIIISAISYIAGLIGQDRILRYNWNLTSLYLKLPETTRDRLADLGQKAEVIKQESINFIDRQIKEIEKRMVEQISGRVIEMIEKQ